VNWLDREPSCSVQRPHWDRVLAGSITTNSRRAWHFEANPIHQLPPFESHCSRASQLSGIWSLYCAACVSCHRSQVPCWPVGSRQEATVSFDSDSAVLQERLPRPGRRLCGYCTYVRRTLRTQLRLLSEDLPKDHGESQNHTDRSGPGGQKARPKYSRLFSSAAATDNNKTKVSCLPGRTSLSSGRLADTNPAIEL